MERTHSKASLKVRPMAMASPTLFIEVPRRGVGVGELLEGEAGPFDDDVIDGRLEGGAGQGDVVAQLVEAVTDGELGGDLGDGVAGGLGGQGAGARDAGVHLDDDDAAVVRVDGELDVGAAGLHADLAHHPPRRVAQALVLAVGEGQRRGHGDGVAGVDAHGLEVLDGADHDEVVAAWSRITSSSNSFQPRTLSSMSTSPVGEHWSAQATFSSSSSGV